MSPIALPMFQSAKWSFSTRRVDQTRAAGLNTDFAAVRPGDLILAGSLRSASISAFSCPRDVRPASIPAI